MAIGIKYEWIEQLLKRRVTMDVSKLLGRDVREVIAMSLMTEEQRKEEILKEAAVPETLTEQFARRNTDNTLSAARERYLQRKAAQDLNASLSKKKKKD